MPNTPSSSSSSAASSASPASPTYTQTPGDDLRKHPIVNPLSGSVTIGDLHGNTVLMLYFLIKSGVLKLKDPGDYDKFVNAHKCLFEKLVLEPSRDIYNEAISNAKKVHTTLTDIEKICATDEFKKTFTSVVFQKTLNRRLTIDPKTPDPAREKKVNDRKEPVNKALEAIREVIKGIKVTDKKCIVRFIGDMLSDRGPCDYATLLLLKKLQDNNKNIDVHILFSNHDDAFLAHYPFETNKNFQFRERTDIKILGFQVSLQSMIGLISANILEAKEIDGIVAQYYLPRLMLIDVSKNKHIVKDKPAPGEETAVTKFYTHAPTGPTNIQNLASAFKREHEFDKVHFMQKQAHELEKEAIAARATKDAKNAEKTDKAKQASAAVETNFRNFVDSINKKYQELCIAGKPTGDQILAVHSFVRTRKHLREFQYEAYPKEIAFNVHGHDGVYNPEQGNLNGSLGAGDLLYTIKNKLSYYWTEVAQVHSMRSGLLVEMAAAEAHPGPAFFQAQQTTSNEDLMQQEEVDLQKIVKDFITKLKERGDATPYDDLLKIPEKSAKEALDKIIHYANEDATSKKTREILKEMGVKDVTPKTITKEQIIEDYCHPQEAIAASANKRS